MTDLAIAVEGLAKKYRIGATQPGYKTLRESLTEAAGAPWRQLRSALRGGDGGTPLRDPEQDVLWALREVSFSVRRGEVLGVIGRNGAGKTTLLKLLSRISEPSAGRALIWGRVGSLLEVGTGFHPELTGRENIYLNSSILGMRRREIERKLDQIVAFAELEKFIDTPVKRYSSGMTVRLAFSVAAHLENDILLVDEVLAVGDYAFQSKCLGKMDSLGESGRTVMLVSHNLAAIRRLAPRTLWFDQGRLRQEGETADVVAAYLEAGSEFLRHGERIDLRRHPTRAAGSEPAMIEARIRGSQGQNGLIPMGADLEIEVAFSRPEPLHKASLSISIEDEEGTRIFWANTRSSGLLPELARAGTFTCTLPRFPLNHGTYYLTFQLLEGSRRIDRIDQACSFQMVQLENAGPDSLLPSGKSLLVWPSECSFEEEPLLAAAGS